MSIPNKLTTLDELARTSDWETLHKILESQSLAHFSRKNLTELATVFRRESEVEKALLILRRLVYDSADTTNAEVHEYITCLSLAGAHAEAFGLLENVRDQTPAALLAECSLLVSQWRYAESIPLWESYCSMADNSYTRLIGQINLLAAKLACGTVNAEEIEAFGRHCLDNGAVTLFANSLELSAQLAFQNDQMGIVQGRLDVAERLLGPGSTLNHILVEKWRLLSKLKLNPGSTTAVDQFIEKTHQSGHAEAARDTFWHRGQITENDHHLNYVWHGTPYESFRQKISRALPRHSFAADFHWFGQADRSSDRLFDPAAETEGLSHLMRMMIKSISQDFFQYPSPGQLSGLIYPDETFHPFYSREKIRQLVNRCNQYFESRKVGLRIRQHQGRYGYDFKEGWGIRCSLDNTAFSAEFERISARLQSFNNQQLCELLSCSKATANRKITQWIENGWLKRSGNGRATTYSIV